MTSRCTIRETWCIGVTSVSRSEAILLGWKIGRPGRSSELPAPNKLLLNLASCSSNILHRSKQVQQGITQQGFSKLAQLSDSFDTDPCDTESLSKNDCRAYHASLPAVTTFAGCPPVLSRSLGSATFSIFLTNCSLFSSCKAPGFQKSYSIHSPSFICASTAS